METAIMPEYITVLIKDDKLYKKLKLAYAEAKAQLQADFILKDTAFGEQSEWVTKFVHYLFIYVDQKRVESKLRTYNLEKKKWVR